MVINGVEYRKFDACYYVSATGDVYSTYVRRCLKHSIDHDGYHRVDIHRTHMKVHKLVYLTWCGDIPAGKQINHIDDNKENNHYLNLYLGDQVENIADCIQKGLADDALRKSMIENGQFYANMMFNPANIAQRLTEVYNRVISHCH